MRIESRTSAGAAHGQRGVALIICMAMLLLITMLGVAAMQTTNMEEHMAGNVQDRIIAFEATEAALRAGENWVAGRTTEPEVNSACASPPCNVWELNATALGDLEAQDHDWWQGNARDAGIGLDHVRTQPHYVIEFQAYVPDSMGMGHNYSGSTGRNYYRVTAQGTGGSDNARILLRSTTTKRFN